jgi:SAM-dependent methyltransferase
MVMETGEYDPMQDLVPRENFPREALDRDIELVNAYYRQVFGIEASPLVVSKKFAQIMGKVAILDAGCGTGNTLRTWREELFPHVASADDIQMIGINKHDYSRESRYPATTIANHQKAIRYIVGNAENMPEVESNSVNIALSFMALLTPQPVRMLDEMVRVTRPGGVIYTNVLGDEKVSNSPLMECLYKLEDKGYGVHVTVGVVAGPTLSHEPWPTTFVVAQKPGIILPS